MAIDDDTLRALAQRPRRHSLISTSEAGSGHPTTCMSAAEIVATLLARDMALDPKDPRRAGTDHWIWVRQQPVPGERRRGAAPRVAAHA